MRQLHLIVDDANTRPDPWQMLFIVVCALILCSCRGPAAREAMMPQSMQVAPMPAGANMPQETMPCPIASNAQQAALNYPGTPRAWPADEYLRDGGDQGLPTGVGPEWEVKGLNMEDTVAHYDTLDGRTLVEPSNEVYIYSPRFGAVRQVVGLVANEERQRAGGVSQPLTLDAPTITQSVGNTKQNLQLGNEISATPPVALRSRQYKDVMSSTLGPKAFQDDFKSFENLAIIKRGEVESAEMPFLAQGANAAIAWSHTQSVHVIIDGQSAQAVTKYDHSQSVYTITDPIGKPKLRIVKVASTPTAKPGDTVDFTIRFDNIGNETIGNVTILDNLSTRLEYIADSAQCSVDSKFYTQPNEGESVIVRCDVTDPIEPGHGGILRFRCRVR